MNNRAEHNHIVLAGMCAYARLGRLNRVAIGLNDFACALWSRAIITIHKRKNRLMCGTNTPKRVHKMKECRKIITPFCSARVLAATLLVCVRPCMHRQRAKEREAKSSTNDFFGHINNNKMLIGPRAENAIFRE